MKNKKGLSGIVTTLIIILLVLAAVGLVWKPISDMLSGGTSSMSKSTLCTGLDFKINKAEVSGTDVEVTIERGATAKDQDPGVKVVMYDNAGSSVVAATSSETWSILQKQMVTVGMDTLTDVESVKVYPVFTDEETGEEVVCDQFFERKVA